MFETAQALPANQLPGLCKGLTVVVVLPATQCLSHPLLLFPASPSTLPLVQLVNVNGTSTTGLDTEGVARRLRGEEGSSVWVKVARRRQVHRGAWGQVLVWAEGRAEGRAETRAEGRATPMLCASSSQQAQHSALPGDPAWPPLRL